MCCFFVTKKFLHSKNLPFPFFLDAQYCRLPFDLCGQFFFSTGKRTVTVIGDNRIFLFCQMASREELQLLRTARSGDPDAQCALGKLYLFGSKNLPQSPATALHWLSRSAARGNMDAKLLIGSHISYEMAQTYPDRAAVESWYRDALENGNHQAGLVLAKLILSSGNDADENSRSEAIRILETIADQDIAEAQWLLAELVKQSPKHAPMRKEALKWTERAADAGIPEAQMALVEHALENADHDSFLKLALPLARSMVQERQQDMPAPDDRSARMLLHCGKLLLERKNGQPDEIQGMWEMAAQSGNTEAAFLLGLWHARMDEHGSRTSNGAVSTSFRRAIRWLTQAGEQGLAKAWYVLSLIYQKAEFSQRDMASTLRYLDIAANLGHSRAQYERGMYAWRNRRDDESNDIQAVYWLQKAVSNGESPAALMLNKIASPACPAPWAMAAMQHLTREAANTYPFLAARIELAAVFGLTRPEALLLDIHSADKGHCLLVDIREHYRRSKRRLVLIQTGKERQTLSRISRLFEKVDCGPKGPEGNYRQRQYRLKTVLPALADEAEE